MLAVEFFLREITFNRLVSECFTIVCKKCLKEKISNRLVLPLKLAVPGGYEYWVGLWNFAVLTKYNRSNLYAMAVFQLSEALKTVTR